MSAGRQSIPEIDASLAASIDRARAGDEDAWRTIYEALSPLVLGYLRSREAAEAEDLTGEVFVQLVRDIDRFDGDAAGFRAWTLTIAHHRLLDSRRSTARKPPPGPLPERAEAIGGTAADAATEALGKLGSQRVLELLAELTDDQQAVLLLRIIGDLTVDQIATALGRRPGAVKALQRRALRRIRDRLEAGVPL